MIFMDDEGNQQYLIVSIKPSKGYQKGFLEISTTTASSTQSSFVLKNRERCYEQNYKQAASRLLSIRPLNVEYKKLFPNLLSRSWPRHILSYNILSCHQPCRFANSSGVWQSKCTIQPFQSEVSECACKPFRHWYDKGELHTDTTELSCNQHKREGGPLPNGLALVVLPKHCSAIVNPH